MLPAEAVHDGIAEFCRPTEPLRHSVKSVGNVAVHGAQQGQNFVTNFVSREVCVGVGTVSDVILSPTLQIFQDVFPRSIEQRANDSLALGRNATESAKTGAANEIEEDGLSIVIKVVSHRNGVGIQLFSQSIKPFVAKAARCHLDAFPTGCCLGLRVKTGDTEVTVPTPTQRLDEVFVAFALLTTKLEIAVGDSHNVGVHLLQEKKHGDRIGTTAHGNDETLSGRNDRRKRVRKCHGKRKRKEKGISRQPPRQSPRRGEVLRCGRVLRALP